MPEKKDWTFEEIDKLYKRLFPDAVDGTGVSVVVAEDSAPMRSVICAALKKKGFTTFDAANGLTALKMIRDKIPDCVVLDINLPQVSGFDILEAIKGDPRYANIPVVLCTARKEKRDILLAQKYGAAGYITKPFQMEDLLKKVRACCGGE